MDHGSRGKDLEPHQQRQLQLASARDADHFVRLLRTRWGQVLSSRILPLVDGFNTREGGIRPLPSFWNAPQKHEITLMPQARPAHPKLNEAPQPHFQPRASPASHPNA